MSLDFKKNFFKFKWNLLKFIKVLKSFGIMDYSLLLGIHNVDKEKNSAAIDHFESRFERQNEHTNTAHAEQLHTSNDKNDPKLAKINKVFSM